jgi:rhamnose transport system ATP-binding protein
MSPLAELVGISHHYGGAQALSEVSIAFAPGTVHALVGENGAGKSTLGKILAGAVAPSEGRVVVRGERRTFAHPRDALVAGIALVHQEIALAPALSVLDNVFLGGRGDGALRGRRARQRRRLHDLMEDTGLRLDPDARVENLRVAEQQLVEILRALARDAELIVMDEPTAPLSPAEVEPLMAVIRGLRERGRTIVYVSHRLEEVLELADTVTVLKDGELVETRPVAGLTEDHLITAMLGRSASATFPAREPGDAEAPVVLEVRNLCRGAEVRDVSFTLRAGEIVGMAGLVGSGRSETARLVFGADRADSGEIVLCGRTVTFRSCAEAVRAGVAMLPEDRKTQGLVMSLGIEENLTLPSLGGYARAGVVSSRGVRRAGAALAERVGVRPRTGGRTVAALSGGNQQKVALGKWLAVPPRVLILDEPTRGVDIGAKRSIYELITELARQGTAVLMISSDLLEVEGLSHRILVMHRGRLARELPCGAAEQEILSAAFGRTTQEA